MNYDFFADKTDKIEILKFIFEETDLRVFDLNSLYEQLICEYTSAEEIDAKFDLENEDLKFQLWSSRFKGNILFRKIELNPKYCKGFNFRYSTDGWGLIQLYFGGQKKNNLLHSHIGHFTPKSAAKYEGINQFNGKVDAWDWNEIEQTSRKLKYQIQNKMSVSKIGSTSVMRNAEKLKDLDIKFI